MTDGEEEEEDEDDGEKADLRGEEDDVVDKEDGRGLLMDRSTGSVCVWKCRSCGSRCSVGSGFTLLRKKGTPSMAEKGRTLGDCGNKRHKVLKILLSNILHISIIARSHLVTMEK